MVARDGGQTLRQTIAHNHIYTDGMDKFLHFGVHCRTSCGEEMGILKPQFLTHQREDGPVEHLILEMEGQRWTTTF